MLINSLEINGSFGSTFWKRWMDLSSNSLLVRLGEVGAHVALEVEVGQLIGGLQLEESRKLLVRVDLASIVLVL